MGAKMGMENPLFLCHERAAKATTVINGKEYINFSTYDYLDLNTHPEITEAVTEAAKVFGSSAGASRLVGGERPPHRQLERALDNLSRMINLGFGNGINFNGFPLVSRTASPM